MEPQTRLLEYRPKRPPSGQRFAVLHEAAESGRPRSKLVTAALMEAMRTARLRLLRYKHELEVVDDPVHGQIIGYEGDDLHLTALMEPLTLLHEYCKAALMEAMRTTRLPHFGQTIGSTS